MSGVLKTLCPRETRDGISIFVSPWPVSPVSWQNSWWQELSLIPTDKGSAWYIVPSLFRAKETFVVNEEIPKKESSRDLAWSKLLPSSDSSLAPHVQCSHLVYLQSQGRPLLPWRKPAMASSSRP